MTFGCSFNLNISMPARRQHSPVNAIKAEKKQWWIIFQWTLMMPFVFHNSKSASKSIDVSICTWERQALKWKKWKIISKFSNCPWITRQVEQSANPSTSSRTSFAYPQSAPDPRTKSGEIFWNFHCMNVCVAFHSVRHCLYRVYCVCDSPPFSGNWWHCICWGKHGPETRAR